MTIKEYLAALAEKINGDEWLVARHCTAFSEQNTTDAAVMQQLRSAGGGVSIIVSVGAKERAGGIATEGLAVRITELNIHVSEIPPLNREVAGHVTAEDAATHLIFMLDSPSFLWKTDIPDFDPQTKVLSLIQTYSCSIWLTDPAASAKKGGTP